MLCQKFKSWIHLNLKKLLRQKSSMWSKQNVLSLCADMFPFVRRTECSVHKNLSTRRIGSLLPLCAELFDRTEWELHSKRRLFTAGDPTIHRATEAMQQQGMRRSNTRVVCICFPKDSAQSTSPFPFPASKNCSDLLTPEFASCGMLGTVCRCVEGQSDCLCYVINPPFGK